MTEFAVTRSYHFSAAHQLLNKPLEPVWTNFKNPKENHECNR